MKISAAEKAIAQLEGRRTMQASIQAAIKDGATIESIQKVIDAMNFAIDEIRSVMPAPAEPVVRKPRAAKKGKKEAAA